MNAPRSESQEKALKVVVEWYLQMEWEDAQLSAKAFESLAELLLTIWEQAQETDIAIFSYITKNDVGERGRLLDIRFKDFNVTWPLQADQETLPTEEKK